MFFLPNHIDHCRERNQQYVVSNEASFFLQWCEFLISLFLDTATSAVTYCFNFDCFDYFSGGLKFVNEKKHLQLKRGDDAVFDFSFIVDSGETVKEVFFGYDGSKEINQIIAVHTGNLVFNPKLNVFWSNKVDITVDLTSTAKLVLSKVTEKSLFDITFFCKIKYTVGAELIEKKSKIKLEIVCKYSTNEFFLMDSSPRFLQRINRSHIGSLL